MADKACGSGACQHTCSDPDKCAHAWTLRYWADGKQRERSFKDEVRSGRTAYGSGRKLAQAAQLKLTVDKRSGDKTFADHTQAGKANFGEAAEAFISHLPVSDHPVTLTWALTACMSGRPTGMPRLPAWRATVTGCWIFSRW